MLQFSKKANKTSGNPSGPATPFCIKPLKLPFLPKFLLIFASYFAFTFLCSSLTMIPHTSFATPPTNQGDPSSTLAVSVTPANLNFQLAPTPTGIEATKEIEVIVETDNATGYELFMSSDSLDASLLHTDGTSTIQSTTNTTANTLTNNTWGYYPSSITSNPNPIEGSRHFLAIPALGSETGAGTSIAITNAPSPSSLTTITIGTKVDLAIPAGSYSGALIFTAVTNALPPQEEFKFTIDTTMTDTVDTDPDHLTGNATEFRIPTSGFVSGTSNYAYNWIIHCGGPEHIEQPITGTSGTSGANADGILCSYQTPGEYQITIKPNGTATTGWMNAFGFYTNTVGANAQTNKNLFKSIDTPFTNLSRTPGTTYRFAYVFYNARNAIGIPANLFAYVDTVGASDLSHMFRGTFQEYAYNSSSATIPAGLFSSISTTNASNLGNMFNSTFYSYARNSTLGNIPANLFGNISVASGATLTYMFYGTFSYYAYNSATATIPTGLFSSINTTGANILSYMFRNTFYYYARNSISGTIPDGLFDSINTTGASNLDNIFNSTFYYYAYSSTSATIPDGLFDAINTTGANSLNGIFSSTFWNYAYSSTSGTIPDGLFDSIDTTSASSLSDMFSSTFGLYAYSSTSGTIPNNLFNSINTANATNVNNLFSRTFHYYANANKLGNTPDTDINDIWGNADLSGITAANAGGSSGAFYLTFTYMPSLLGDVQLFVNTKWPPSGIAPSPATEAFTGTNVTNRPTGW